MEGWSEVKDEDKELILKFIREHEATSPKKAATPKKKATGPKKASEEKKPYPKGEASKKSPENKNGSVETERAPIGDPKHKDSSFREFRRLCAKIADIASYNSKVCLTKKEIRFALHYS